MLIAGYSLPGQPGYTYSKYTLLCIECNQAIAFCNDVETARDTARVHFDQSHKMVVRVEIVSRMEV